MIQAPAQTISQAIRDQRRDRIIQVAKSVFFEEGYAAASMSMIAQRLGGSKATLYAYFKSKEDLFRAIVSDQCCQVQDAIDAQVDDTDVRRALTNLGVKLMDMLLDDSSVRMLQLLVEEGPRSPGLARLFMEAGPQQGEQRLTEFFARAKAQGQLDIPDANIAARQFSALVKGNLHFKRTLGLIEQPTPERIRQEVDEAVEMFMRAYGVKAAND
ncbi:MAG: TetR/AcrR family transcriptional regulator C-terminal domain-containing protein [Phenylobacterium sp.]|uniref:TetR/AcrR family transcriptional regulator C-terminal domain-containing protein n=1 Tax=Phenylobacterium sp. TaxID=1871053 RepID=UPI003918F50A